MELKDLQEEWKEKTKLAEEDYALVDIFSNLCRKAQEMIFFAFSMAERKLYSCSWYCQTLVDMTPIEQIYSVAFLTYNQTNWSAKSEKRILFEITPQAEIKIDDKRYKADFLINSFICKDGSKILEKPIIVECDGYEYHSTKEQRNADTERENDFKMKGYQVIRFTGSQIYKDAYLCIMQTIKFVYDENKEQLKEYFDKV